MAQPKRALSSQPERNVHPPTEHKDEMKQMSEEMDMAAPQHPQRKRVVEEGVTVTKVEELSQQEVEVQVNVSEEMIAVSLFGEMVKKVDEVYQAALGMENSPQLAKVLGEIGVVKVTLQESIRMLKEAEDMRKAEEGLMASRDAERLSDDE